MADREPRDNETREMEFRKKSWERPTLLPTPNPRPGVKFRWIRTAIMGQSDNPNVSARFREGWTPVLAKDHPELHVMSDIDSRWKDNIEIGGQLLCSISTEKVEARKEAHKEMANRQMESVDNSFLRNNDPRMPVLKPERSTRTT
jgi:hypothetical protein|tara:strand:+ start:34 stop:468 length:435 start_codon:yes stop_codon:yes gene_type:complete